MSEALRPSIPEIVHAVITNERPSKTDGITNLQRGLFIQEAFDVEGFNIMAVYRFEEALKVDDPDLVEATIHLAALQFQVIDLLGRFAYVTEEEVLAKCGTLELAMEKLNWHLKHLKNDEKTPPYLLH